MIWWAKSIKKIRSLNYFEHFILFVSAVIGCFSISAFASLVDVPVGIANSAVGLTIRAGIRKYKSIIKVKRKKLMI